MSQRSEPHILHVAMAVLAIVMGATNPIEAAEACPEDTGSVTCFDQLGQTNLNALLSSDMTSGRIDTRITSKPWIAQSWSSAPFALAQSDTQLKMLASLDHLGGYANRITARRYEDAKVLAPQLVMPNAVNTG